MAYHGRMATYTIDLQLGVSNIEEFIEHLRTLGAVESVQFSIEADNRREAVRETAALLEEFSSTYRGVAADTEDVEDNLRRVEPRTAYSF